MGKANRRKKVDPAKLANYRPPIPFVNRPFEGLAVERELVAMREIIPCATLPAKTNPKHGEVEFEFVTLLPDGAGAVVRTDGQILVGLQTRFHTGDLSHDLAAALLAAIALKDSGETGVAQFDVRDPAPRLQEVLGECSEMQITDSFEFWLDPTEETTPEREQALEQNREEMVPTQAIDGVEGMFWCSMHNNFVRYVLDVDEDKLFTALARLQAAEEATLGPDSKFVGAFRACGIAIPVFQVSSELTVEELAEPAQQLAERLKKALAKRKALTPEERRARDGLVSRQVTVR